MKTEDMADQSQELQVLEPLGRGEVLAQSAEISQQVSTARAYPRRSDPMIAREVVSRATLNDEIAGECMFLLPRGGKTIPGPSIRFAEIVRASYGNIRVATRFVRLDIDDPANAAVIVEAIAYDMQTNNSETVFERRSVMTTGKNGQRPKIYSPDMIAQTAGAARSIARRNAILAVVPKALWIDGYYAAVEVARGNAENLQERREKVFAAFKKLGVEAAPVCAALGLKEPSEITLEHMPSLMAMYAAIRDGETAASVFERLGVEVIKHDVVSSPLKEAAEPTGHMAKSAVFTVQPKEDAQPEKQQEKPAATISAEVIEQQKEQQRPKATAMPENEMQAEQTQKPAEPQGPTTAEEYETAFMAFLKTAKTESSIRDRWGKEAPLRKKLGVDADAIERLVAAKEAATTALRAAASA